MRNNITKASLVKLLAKYDLGQIKDFEQVATSGNYSFFITTTKGQYFLRLSGERHRARTPLQVEGELDLIDYLKSNNFPVLAYEKTKAGRRVVGLAGSYGYLRKFLPADFVTGNPTPEQLTEVGQLLGQYHNLVLNFTANNKRETLDFGLVKTKEYLFDHQSEFLASNLQSAPDFVAEFKKAINDLNFSADLPQGMLHEDLGKRHVLWQNDKIISLIDFDRSYFGPLVLDLGQALRGWCFIDNWQHWSLSAAQIFLTSYESVRKLSTLEKDSLLAAIKFAILERALSFYSIAVYSLQLNTAEEQFAIDSLTKQLPQIKNLK